MSTDSGSEDELDVYIGHPEIVHYTDWAGLNGMVVNRTIWATRYDFLNDASEVYHLRDFLRKSIKPHIVSFWLQQIRSDSSKRQHVQKHGGLVAVAEHEADAIVGSIYHTSFVGNPGSTAFSIPFITSFCSHVNDDDYLKQNGLLSQWRAYGGTGTERFAVIFDTKKLSNALMQEAQKFQYPFLQFSDVIYNDDMLDFPSRFDRLVRAMCKAYDSLFAENRGEGINEETFRAFLSAATRLKHRAFHEEREVRIAAAPTTVELQTYIKQKLGVDEADGKEIKPIRYRERNGAKVPYIALLEGQNTPLPIVRIIVGPCRQQGIAEEKVRNLVGNNVPVTRSETPFLG